MLKHLGIIPDGNRRFSEKNGIGLEKAYIAGFEKAEEVFDWVLEIPTIKRATIYALSTENFERTSEELAVLTQLYDLYFRKLAKDKKIHGNEVKVRIIGRINTLNGLSDAVKELHEATEDYDKYVLNIALGYGGRSEIFDAVKKIHEQGIDFNKLDEKTFSKYLYEPNDVDLLIRTGDRHRISNFLTWQTAYTEFYFSDLLWPEFDRKEFNKALDFYKSTQRNFGK